MKRTPLTRIRLSDIPLDRRLQAARVAVKTADQADRHGILLAAMFPSDRVYFVSEASCVEPLRVAA